MSLRIGLFYPNAPAMHVMSRSIIKMNPKEDQKKDIHVARKNKIK